MEKNNRICGIVQYWPESMYIYYSDKYRSEYYLQVHQNLSMYAL